MSFIFRCNLLKKNGYWFKKNNLSLNSTTPVLYPPVLYLPLIPIYAMAVTTT